MAMTVYWLLETVVALSPNKSRYVVHKNMYLSHGTDLFKQDQLTLGWLPIHIYHKATIWPECTEQQMFTCIFCCQHNYRITCLQIMDIIFPMVLTFSKKIS